MRRIRNFNGEISYRDIDDNIIENQIGSGWFTNALSNMASKVTSDTSKKLATIAAENVSKKIGEEIGNQGAKKIDRMINTKKKEQIKTDELAGEKIAEILQKMNKEPIYQKNNQNENLSRRLDALLE